MKKLLSFICAVLIAVFAVMPNANAEEQKTYGNLDMNRWMVIAQTDEVDTLIDKVMVDYTSDYKNNLLCNFWVCYFYNNENKYVFHNLTINYQDRSLCVNETIDYNKQGELQDSYTTKNKIFDKIVPGSWGEVFLYMVFHPDNMEAIKKYVKENESK